MAHAIHGRIGRIYIPHYAIHIGVGILLLGVIATIGLFSGYVRMASESLAFDDLRLEKEALQQKYDALVEVSEERRVQLESLSSLATEISLAFGIKRQVDDESGPRLNPPLAENYVKSVKKYDVLQSVQLSTGSSNSIWGWLENTTPSIWPVQGRLSSSFGKRQDPFHGTGSFHAGVDLKSNHGAPIVATADGLVTHSGWFAKYGKRVVLDHGNNGLSTSYAHMSKFYVRPGQIVRRGEVIGQVGQTGKSTSPHLHYEVRYLGTPINPYRYLHKPLDSRLAFQVAD